MLAHINSNCATMSLFEKPHGRKDATMIDKRSQEYMLAWTCVAQMGYKVSVFDVETGKHTIFRKECDAQEFGAIVDDCNLWEGQLGEVNFGLEEVSLYIGRDRH